MTRDELIEKVANAIWHDRARRIPKSMNDLAEEIIDTIFEELKEPTEEMSVLGCKADDPLGELVDWNGNNCTTREAVNAVWQAMLNTSPLAPEGNINNDND